MLQNQQQRIEKQTDELDRMNKKLKEMEKAMRSVPQPLLSQPQVPEADTEQIMVSSKGPAVRDNIGDLNEEAIKVGDFPGSFKIPGTKNVSLALGGFVKTVGIYDSNAEAMGANFLPATLGTKRSDENGATSLDATLTRLLIDGRAPARSGQLRGYVEYDLNDANNGSLGFKLRHAYGTWKNDYGTLLAGHTWSTMMDLKIIPEGLTEPTVSGVIFMRQPMIRWSQPLTPEWILHVAVEDPNSNDVFSDEPSLGNTEIPDGVLGIEYDRAGIWHVRLNTIARDIKVDMPTGGDDSKTAWGLALSGHLNLFKRDKIVLSGVYGKGLGRYLLGIEPSAGSVIDPNRNELRLRDNWGWMTAYQHLWKENLRSTLMFGYARSKPFDWQDGDTFKNSTYTAANLMWSVLPYLTVGVEYAYGRRENKDDSYLDNHRIALGIQMF